MKTFTMEAAEQYYTWKFLPEDWSEVIDDVILKLRTMPLTQVEKSYIVIKLLTLKNKL